jgi:hypothetical protein
VALVHERTISKSNIENKERYREKRIDIENIENIACKVMRRRGSHIL